MKIRLLERGRAASGTHEMFLLRAVRNLSFAKFFFFFFLPSWDTDRGPSMCELTVLQITVLNSLHSPSRGKNQGLRELRGLVPGQGTAQRLAPSSPSLRPQGVLAQGPWLPGAWR